MARIRTMNGFLSGFAVLVVLASSLLVVSGNMPAPGFNVTQNTPAPTPDITSTPVSNGGTYEVVIDEPAYYGDSRGYLARPAGEGVFPGVVMIHEWWGLNDSVKNAAARLASSGYMVLAVDLYNGQVASTQEKAQALSSGIDEVDAIQNMQAAVAYLQEQGASKVASWGWCFGGGQSLILSLSGIPLNATVIYYGNLETDPELLSAIRWPVQGIFGDKDAVVTPASVKQFKAALNRLGIKNEIHIYRGLGHAFANPTGPSYAPDETKDAWNKTILFLDKALKSESI